MVHDILMFVFVIFKTVIKWIVIIYIKKKKKLCNEPLQKKAINEPLHIKSNHAKM
jgi:hypothetical protein